MDAIVPWRDWQQLLRDDKGGAAAALDTISSFLHHGAASVSPKKAFNSLWRLRCAPAHETDADLAELLLLTAIVSRSERELASRLLDFHPTDALRNLSLFVDALEKWGDDAGIPSAALKDQLDLAINVLSAVHASSFNDRDSKKIQSQEDDAMSWEEFAALPSGLDHSALGKTKTGRALQQHLTEIVEQQQWRLGRSESDIRNALREVADRLSRSGEKLPANSSVEDSASVGKLEECEDDDAILRYLERAADRDANPTSAPLANDSSPIIVSEEPSSSMANLLRTLESTARVTVGYDKVASQIIAELESIGDEVALSVDAALVLRWQRRRGETIVDGVTYSTAMEWEQKVRKQVNSLTSTVDGDDQLFDLVRLAGIYPTAVIDALMASAMATTQYHQFVWRLLWLCPTLGRWQLDENASLPQLLELLAAEIARLVNCTDVEAPIHDAPVFKFSLTLSGCCVDKTKEHRAVVQPDVLLGSVLWANFTPTRDAASFASVTRRLELVYHFVSRLRRQGSRVSSALITASLDVAFKQYQETSASVCGEQGESVASIELRDVALFLVRELLPLCPSEVAKDWAASDKVLSAKHTDTALQTLLASVFSQPPAKLPRELSQLSIELSSHVQNYLWSSVWMCDLSDSSSDGADLASWSARKILDSTGATVTGASLIQTEMTKMMLVVGTRSFNQIVKMAGISLLPAFGVTSLGGAESPVDSSSALPSPVHVMLYIARCWALAALSSGRAQSHLVLRMLARLLNLLEEAIESSAADVPALLCCLEVVGFAWCWKHANDLVASGIVNRLENAAIRILFLLARQPTASPSPVGGATPESIVKILASTRLLESEGVKRHLRLSE